VFPNDPSLLRVRTALDDDTDEETKGDKKEAAKVKDDGEAEAKKDAEDTPKKQLETATV